MISSPGSFVHIYHAKPAKLTWTRFDQLLHTSNFGANARLQDPVERDIQIKPHSYIPTKQALSCWTRRQEVTVGLLALRTDAKVANIMDDACFAVEKQNKETVTDFSLCEAAFKIASLVLFSQCSNISKGTQLHLTTQRTSRYIVVSGKCVGSIKRVFHIHRATGWAP